MPMVLSLSYQYSPILIFDEITKTVEHIPIQANVSLLENKAYRKSL